MTLLKLLAEIKACQYACEAGPLENNVAFQELERLARNAPHFLPGSLVSYEVTAEAHGEKFSKVVNFTVTGCQLQGFSDRARWGYTIQKAPPSAYYDGSDRIQVGEGVLMPPQKDGAA